MATNARATPARVTVPPVRPTIIRNSASALIAVTLAFSLALTAGQQSAAAPAFTWSPVIDLSEAGGNATASQIVAAGDGSLTAIWVRRDVANHQRAQVARSTDGGSTWTTPETLSAAGANAVSAQLAAGSDNTIMATWVRHDGSNNIIQASHFDGTSWGTPENLSAAGAEANSVEITARPGGSFAAIWDRSDGSAYVVQVGHFDGAAWGPPVDVGSSSLSALPDIAASGSEMVAVWQRNEGVSINSIQGSHFDGTTWGPAEYLSPASPVATSPRVTGAPDGTFAAVWSANGLLGSPSVVRARIFDGAWNPVTDVSDGLSNTRSPQLTAISGGFMVVWQNDLAPIRVETSSYDGTVWTPPVTLSDPTRPSRLPFVASDGGVTAAAVWLQEVGGNNVVFSKNFDGTVWSDAASLSAAGQAASRTSVVVLPDGTFVAIWQRSNGAHQIIQSAFTMSAPIITSPPPPAPTLGSAYSFQVTASGNPRPTFAITSGALPAGLAMSSGGLITGTPTAPGSSTFTVTAANGMAPNASATYTLVIPAAAAAPPAAAPASAQLAASGTDPLPLVIAGFAALGLGAALLASTGRRVRKER